MRKTRKRINKLNKLSIIKKRDFPAFCTLRVFYTMA